MQSQFEGFFYGTTPETGPIVYEFSEEGTCKWHTLANVQVTDFYFNENDSKIAFCVPSLRQKIPPVTEVPEAEVPVVPEEAASVVPETEAPAVPEEGAPVVPETEPPAVPEEGAPVVPETEAPAVPEEGAPEETAPKEEANVVPEVTSTKSEEQVEVKDSIDSYNYKLKLHGYIDVINKDEMVLYQSKVANAISEMDKCDIVRCKRVDTPNVIFECDMNMFEQDEHVRKLKCLAECREKVCKYIDTMELPKENVNISTIMRHPTVHKMLTIEIPSSYGLRFNAFMKDSNSEVKKLFSDTIMQIEATSKRRLVKIMKEQKAKTDKISQARAERKKLFELKRKKANDDRMIVAASVGIVSSLLTVAGFVLWHKKK